MSRLRKGDTLADRWVVVGLIGKGAMGSVYEVREEGSNGRFALKVMHAELFEADPRAAHRFAREARLGGRLDHPNIVKTVATGVDDDFGAPWLAMPYVDGRTLTEIMKAPDAPAGSTQKRLITELFDATATAHAAGVVHRDIKPDNVMITNDAVPSLKVLDFGIAKEMRSVSMSVTATGLGTPLWAAPEQNAMGFVPTPRADVWALGLVTFFALTTKIYWLNANQGGSIASLALELLRSPIEPPSHRARELSVGKPLPGGFDGWFEKCVSRDATRRFGDAASAFRVLEPMLPGD